MPKTFRLSFLAQPFMDFMVEPARLALAQRGHVAKRFTTTAEFEADREAVEESDVIIAMPQLEIARRHIEAARHLRAIVSPITGTEGFDMAAASEHCILVANGQIPENYISMAESTIMMVLAALYDLPGAMEQLRRNEPRPKQLRAHMLYRKTVGLIGFGQIARAVAERLAAWDVRIITTIRSGRPLPAAVTAVPLETLLSESDVVCVLIALADDTVHLLNDERLRLMKPNVVFCNMARGPIVDEKALIDLAAERPQMRLALDVFEMEPLPAESPLRGLPKTVLTPHIVGHTVETHDILPHVVLEQVDSLLKGELPLYVVNTGIADDWLKRWSPSAGRHPSH